MVGRADDDGVDIATVEELAVILVHLGFSLTDAPVVPGPFGVLAVDVADGQEIAVAACTVRIARALPSRADQAESRPVVLGRVSSPTARRKARGTERARGCSPRHEGNRGGCGWGCGGSSWIFLEHRMTRPGSQVPRAPGPRP